MPKINLTRYEIVLIEPLIISKWKELNNEKIYIKGKMENIKLIYRSSKRYKELKSYLKATKRQIKNYMKIYKKLNKGRKKDE